MRALLRCSRRALVASGLVLVLGGALGGCGASAPRNSGFPHQQVALVAGEARDESTIGSGARRSYSVTVRTDLPLGQAHAEAAKLLRARGFTSGGTTDGAGFFIDDFSGPQWSVSLSGVTLQDGAGTDLSYLVVPAS